MLKEDKNEDVYDFLSEECRHYPKLWEKFGEGILSHIEDENFWNSLSEHFDCFRVCDECGKPIIAGYVVDGCDTYCSDECLYKHITDEEFEALYDNGDGNTYWTTWYEDSATWRNISQ